ncbi:hypothetical protein [Actinomadura sp. WMMA1423]|nr:hypothetical protein [Actinomadura sp. WMMA1423]
MAGVSRNTVRRFADPSDDDYLEAHFMTLLDVYRRAAEAGAGMKIMAW